MFASLVVLGACLLLFQNCEKFSALSATAVTAACAQNASSSNCFVQPASLPICTFNGKVIAQGATVTAYLSSAVTAGSTCLSQARTCTSGSLSGSYNYANCSVGAAAACLFNGQTIADGQSITAYLSSQVAIGQTCAPQTRECSKGALSGVGSYASCSVAQPSACLFNGLTVASGASIVAYATSSVPPGQTCQSETRSCFNGALSGSDVYASCTVDPQPLAACVINGQTIPSGGSIQLYLSSVSDSAGNCASENRVCSNGSLAGSAIYGSCKKVGITEAQPWQVDGFNSSSLFQDPDDPTLFWGRRLKYSGQTGEDPNNEATWQNWRIALFRADFAAHTMKIFDYTADTNFTTADGHAVYTAYDPTVASIGGVKYLLFECGASGFGTASSCGGPVLSNNHLDTTQTRVWVGANTTSSGMLASASTPKINNFAGQLFVSWSQVLLQPPAYSFSQVQTQSAPFTTSLFLSSDSANSYTIYTPPAHGTADLFGIQAINGNYWFAGARGNAGCTAPLDSSPGCYKLEIGAVSSISANGALDNVAASPIAMPDNPQEYSRWVYDPSQGWGIFGHFLNKFDGPTPLTLANGFYFMPISNMNDFPNFPVKQVAATCNATTQVFPNYGPKAGQCLPSCGVAGGTAAYPDSCSRHGMASAGAAYDTNNCCKPYAATCDQATQPSPNWGVRNNQCMPSCGGIGGTAAFPDACSNHGLSDAGPAYDTAFCCR